MKIQSIDASKFHKIEGIRRIIVHDHARRFALIDLDDLGRYGLSWRSDLIEPIMALSPDGLTAWIGVDQHLAVLCLDQGRILVSLPLSNNIVQILGLETLIAVLTELEVLLFNVDGSLRCVRGLPDIASEMSVAVDELIIQCLEGECLKLNTQTGIFKESAIAL